MVSEYHDVYVYRFPVFKLIKLVIKKFIVCHFIRLGSCILDKVT